MSRITSMAIERAGLSGVHEARGPATLGPEWRSKLESTDLLVLGALADEIRARECGDAVRIYLGEPKDESVVTLPLPERPTGDDAGILMLKDVAIARIVSPKGAHVRVSWADIGMEITLVALGFGADELVGRIASKRGLPLADGAKVGWGKRSTYVPAELAKKQEMAGHIRQAGRKPIFVLPNGTEEFIERPLGSLEDGSDDHETGHEELRA